MTRSMRVWKWLNHLLSAIGVLALISLRPENPAVPVLSAHPDAIWLAPLTFIPFYAAPWVISGLGLLLFGGTGRVRSDGGVGGFFALPAGRRLRDFRSDGRALQDSFFMRFNTRQVTRVL